MSITVTCNQLPDERIAVRKEGGVWAIYCSWCGYLGWAQSWPTAMRIAARHKLTGNGHGRTA